MVIICKKWK